MRVLGDSESMHSQVPKGSASPATGRKPNQESRSAEFRQRLIAWMQTPDSLRPSLRALARELGTSHQLLNFYLKGLDKWQSKQYFHQAHEIQDRAIAEGRLMTDWEEERVLISIRAGARYMATSALLKLLEGIKVEAAHGPLRRHQTKMLKVLARNGFTDAQALLKKYSQTDEAEPHQLELSAKQQELMKTLPKAAARRYASLAGSDFSNSG